MSLDQVWHVAGEGGRSGHRVPHRGRLHPELTLDWYCEMLRGLKERFPQVHRKAFTMVEIGYLAQRTEDFGTRGCSSAARCRHVDCCPAGGAEIFCDRVRRVICDTKLRAEEWLETRAPRTA